MAKKGVITELTDEQRAEQMRQFTEIFGELPVQKGTKHGIETINDMFAVVNRKNLDQFVSDLRNLLDANITGRDIISNVATAFGDERTAKSSEVNLHSFNWIDSNAD